MADDIFGKELPIAYLFRYDKNGQNAELISRYGCMEDKKDFLIKTCETMYKKIQTFNETAEKINASTSAGQEPSKFDVDSAKRLAEKINTLKDTLIMQQERTGLVLARRSDGLVICMSKQEFNKQQKSRKKDRERIQSINVKVMVAQQSRDIWCLNQISNQI